MFLLSLLSVLVVLSIWLVTCRCHIVVVVEVVERLQEVVRIGGGGDEAEVDNDGGREGKCLFVHDVYASFRQRIDTSVTHCRRTISLANSMYIT